MYIPELRKPAERFCSLINEFSRSIYWEAPLEISYACEALFKGIPLFYRDEDRAKLMRANLLGMYLQFNRDRSEVLNAYRA